MAAQPVEVQGCVIAFVAVRYGTLLAEAKDRKELLVKTRKVLEPGASMEPVEFLARIRLAGGAEVCEPIEPDILVGAMLIQRPCYYCRNGKGWMRYDMFKEERKHMHESNLVVDCLKCGDRY